MGNEARASFISLKAMETEELDKVSLENRRIALENELIMEKLSELGLSDVEIDQWISQLSRDEREVVLKELETIQNGGQNSILSDSLFPELSAGGKLFLVAAIILVLIILTSHNTYK
jgi:hypothetical protein